MKFFASVALVVACLGSASCNQQKLIDQFTPKAEAAMAKSTLDDLRKGKLDTIESRLAPNLRNDPAVDAKLHQLAGYFPPGEPHSMKTVGAFSNTFNGVKHVRLTYEYQFDASWLVAEVAMVQDGDKILIEGLHVNRTEHSLAQTNAFSLQGKGPMAWLMMGLVCVLPLFCLFAFVLCLRTPMRERKWLWAIFTLIGVVTVRLNWANDDFSVSLISVQLFSASASQFLNGPWTLGVSFPLGAMMFLLRRRELMFRPSTAIPPMLPGSDRDSSGV